MKEPDTEHRIAGWYGKIPSLGDFASRRLASELLDVWDAWLQRSIAASRVSLGDRWTEIYLTSPMWRFALMPGVCGKSAWAGVLMPSVDKVGRYFPLTVALPIDNQREMPKSIFDAQSWYAELERVALLALNIDFTADDLERALAEHPFPLSNSPLDCAAPNVEELARWWTMASVRPQYFGFVDLVQVTDALSMSLQSMIRTSTTGRSLWWSAPPAAGPAVLHCCDGLPPDEYFTVLLQGDNPSPEPTQEPVPVPDGGVP